MISWLARIGSPQAIGIHLAGNQVHACRVASTPLGTVLLAQQSESVDGPHPQQAIKRLIEKLSPRRGGPLPIAIGMPLEQLFFTTRPMQVGGGQASPRVLLREAMFSSAVSVDKMVVDVIQSQPGSRKLATIVACDKPLVEDLVQSLEQSGLTLLRVEPSPCALVRRGLLHDRTHRRARVACRVFLNHTQVLAVLAAQGRPVLWRQAKLSRGDEASGILAVVRSLTTISDQSGLEMQPELVVIHGRSDLPRLLDMDWIRQQIGMRLEWLDEPALDDLQIAIGLAEGCLGDDERSFDLARGFQRRRPLWQLFPWRELVFHVALVAILVSFLSYRLVAAKNVLIAAKMRNSQSLIAAHGVAELEQQKNDLTQRVAAVKKFLDGRVVWTNYERELAASLPEDVFLTSIRGISEFAAKSANKGKAKRQLVLKCAVSLQQTGLIPYAVDRLMNSLRAHPTLTRDFPVIELAELKQFKRPENDETLALFTLVCLPQGAQKSGP